MRALSIDSVRAFHQRHYTKGNTALVLTGARDCKGVVEALAEELEAFPAGEKIKTPEIDGMEPGPRTLPSTPGKFIQGFYWYGSTLEEELVYQIVAHHLEDRALKELRKERGLAYSPAGRFFRRGRGGQAFLEVDTDEKASTLREWYDRTVSELRTESKPTATVKASIDRVRKAYQADHTRTSLAEIRGEANPAKALDRLTDASLHQHFGRLLDGRRAYGTSVTTGNIGSLIVLAVFGFVVLAAVELAARKLMG